MKRDVWNLVLVLGIPFLLLWLYSALYVDTYLWFIELSYFKGDSVSELFIKQLCVLCHHRGSLVLFMLY